MAGSIHKQVLELAKKIGAPAVGSNVEETMKSINSYLDGTTHGANIADTVEEFKKVYSGGGPGPGPEPRLQEKTADPNVTAVEVFPDSGYDGLSKVTVTAAPLQNKTATPSTIAQTISCDENYYGIGEVAVGAVDNTIDQNILSNNIKKDVVILGVTGSLVDEWQITPYLDKKTHLWLEILPGYTDITLRFAINGTVSISWGDGSEADEVSGTSTSNAKTIDHSYPSTGRYIITMVVTGSMYFTGDSNSGSQIISVSDMSGSGRWMFSEKMLKGLEIGSGVKAGARSLQNITLKMFAANGDNVTIDSNVGTYHRINEIYLYDIDTVSSNITSDYSVEKVVLGDTITTIGNSAFANASKVEEFRIPSSVTSIGTNCFQYAWPSKLIFEGNTPPSVSSNTFSGLDASRTTIYVPTGTLADYTSAQYYPDSTSFTYVEY